MAVFLCKKLRHARLAKKEKLKQKADIYFVIAKLGSKNVKTFCFAARIGRIGSVNTKPRSESANEGFIKKTKAFLELTKEVKR